MTERKVLNKYFPPDFDPAKIPRLKGMKKEKVFSIRTMAPFNMMCLTCRGYIFKAKKFNSRMEECEYTYLDLKEYRFHIRCPTCCSEIIYRTDRENNDYVVESGAKRSFEAYTTAIRQAIKESVQEKEELEKNPIKALEKRTEESMNEFKMSNKIQDLMEQSKNDAPREEMIEDAIAILRQKQDTVKFEHDQDIKDMVTKQLKLQSQIEQERLEMEKSTDTSLFDFYESKFASTNAKGLEKLNILKQAIQLKRQRESKSQLDEVGASDTKTPRFDGAKLETSISTIDDIEKPNIDQCNPIDSSKATSSNNPLGIDYDSYSDDDR